jgi:hypothetical protein
LAVLAVEAAVADKHQHDPAQLLASTAVVVVEAAVPMEQPAHLPVVLAQTDTLF